MLRWDFDGEGEWTAMSCVHDDGSIFEWRIQVCDDGTFSVADSDGELCARQETFDTLRDAKTWCEERDNEYFESAKREAAEAAAASEVSEEDSVPQPIVFSTVVEKCPTCGADAIDRSTFWEAAPDNGAEFMRKVDAIEKEFRLYYRALDRGMHGGSAQDRAFGKMQEILGISYVPGETEKFLQSHPKLEPFYRIGSIE